MIGHFFKTEVFILAWLLDHILASIFHSQNFQSKIYLTTFRILGKFQKIKKIRRELKELKASFTGYNLQAIKEEVAPIILSKIGNYLADLGKVNK